MPLGIVFFRSQPVVVHIIHVPTIVILMVVAMTSHGAQLRRQQTENMITDIGNGVNVVSWTLTLHFQSVYLQQDNHQ